jgi:VanZ family protein
MSGQIVVGTSPSIYEPWAGELRGLAIYSKELTVGDVLQHYREWRDPSGPHDGDGIIARYGFAEAAGREIRDDVPSGPNLEIPAIFSVPHKAFLRSATKEFKANWTYARDVLVNVAGFVPLGLIACAYFSWTRSHWKAILITAIACGTLSFVIEVLQYYIPRRFSGTTDIITNTLGAAVGAAIMQASAVRHILKELKLIHS